MIWLFRFPSWKSNLATAMCISRGGRHAFEGQTNLCDAMQVIIPVIWWQWKQRFLGQLIVIVPEQEPCPPTITSSAQASFIDPFDNSKQSNIA